LENGVIDPNIRMSRPPIVGARVMGLLVGGFASIQPGFLIGSLAVRGSRKPSGGEG